MSVLYGRPKGRVEQAEPRSGEHASPPPAGRGLGVRGVA